VCYEKRLKQHLHDIRTRNSLDTFLINNALMPFQGQNVFREINNVLNEQTS
jgi:hypothetical protein